MDIHLARSIKTAGIKKLDRSLSFTSYKYCVVLRIIVGTERCTGLKRLYVVYLCHVLRFETFFKFLLQRLYIYRTV